jgi:mycofactocin system transcriptional regulator
MISRLEAGAGVRRCNLVHSMPKWKRDDPMGPMTSTEGAVPALPEATRGRPASTSRHDVARAAFDLFARQGYDRTTVDEIAAAVGISRRTFFRYFDSKPDVVWGEFDSELARLRDRLTEAPVGEPMMEVLRRSVIATNRFGAGELDELRIRMVLISTVPTLVAHSAVRYEEWCDVVARFAATRIGGSPDDLGPQTVARAALGAALTIWSARWTAPSASWPPDSSRSVPGPERPEWPVAGRR